MGNIACKGFKICVLLVVLLLIYMTVCRKGKRKSHYNYHRHKTTTAYPRTKTLCMQLDSTLRARHKTCFLRPDTGPCRADIVQWYFDVKQRRCYRFFWGGCQGNGNRFETKGQCNDYCYINSTDLKPRIPFFCSLAFDYGNCFGYYNRWAWDKYAKTCKRRLYSGCGGNQNNFESRAECIATCLTPPNNTLSRFHQYTTCVPFSIDELN